MGLADPGDGESEGFLDLGAAWDGGSWKVLDEDLGPVGTEDVGTDWDGGLL